MAIWTAKGVGHLIGHVFGVAGVKVVSDAVQLQFYKKHWGKCQIGEDGQYFFAVEQSELNTFNKTVEEITVLQVKELELMKQNVDTTLHKLNGTEK